MSDLADYFLAQEERRCAYEKYNYAAQKLDNASIKERLAMIKSQHAPLSNLRGANRDEAYAVAFFVVVGRWPAGFDYMERKL